MKRFPVRRWLPIAAALLCAATAVAVFVAAPAGGRWPWPRADALPAASAAAASSAGPIRIGVAVGLSGANSVVAPSVVQSSQLAVEEINAAGGILGRPVQLEIVDDGSDAEGARRALEQLTAGRRVDAVIAMQTSAARNAALPIVARAQRPYLYTSFYEGRACSPWMLANGWVPEQQVAPIVEHLLQQQKARSFFLVGSDYAFGRGMLDFAKQTLRRQGAQVVGEEYLPLDQGDWSAVIAKIRASRADALISATAGGAPNVALARQMRAADLKIAFGNLSIDESTARDMGAGAAGQLLSASYLASIDSPENKAFRMRMLVRFGAELKPPNELSVPQYEAFHLYKAAVEAARSTDAAQVVKALADVAYNGPRGMVRMNRSRHAPLSMRLGQVRSDGSVRILQTFADVDPGSQCPMLDKGGR